MQERVRLGTAMTFCSINTREALPLHPRAQSTVTKNDILTRIQQWIWKSSFLKLSPYPAIYWPQNLKVSYSNSLCLGALCAVHMNVIITTLQDYCKAWIRHSEYKASICLAHAKRSSKVGCFIIIPGLSICTAYMQNIILHKGTRQNQRQDTASVSPGHCPSSKLLHTPMGFPGGWRAPQKKNLSYIHN